MKSFLIKFLKSYDWKKVVDKPVEAAVVALTIFFLLQRAKLEKSNKMMLSRIAISIIALTLVACLYRIYNITIIKRAQYKASARKIEIGIGAAKSPHPYQDHTSKQSQRYSHQNSLKKESNGTNGESEALIKKSNDDKLKKTRILLATTMFVSVTQCAVTTLFFISAATIGSIELLKQQDIRVTDNIGILQLFCYAACATWIFCASFGLLWLSVGFVQDTCRHSQLPEDLSNTVIGQYVSGTHEISATEIIHHQCNDTFNAPGPENAPMSQMR